MEAKGIFQLNPANAGAQDATGTMLYNGPVQYPKMFYHPKGEERVIVQATTIDTPYGPKQVGEQKELIHRSVNNEQEEELLRKQGWHSRPADAMRAAGKEAPATGAEGTIEDLRRQIDQLQKAKAALERDVPPEKPDLSHPFSKPAA